MMLTCEHCGSPGMADSCKVQWWAKVAPAGAARANEASGVVIVCIRCPSWLENKVKVDWVAEGEPFIPCTLPVNLLWPQWSRLQAEYNWTPADLKKLIATIGG